MDTENEPIVVIVEGHKYDVTNYNHPGEGHNDMYLENFDGKDVTKEFHYYHAKTIGKNMKLLEKVRNKGTHSKIVYLGKCDFMNENEI